jgi:hypothetical protein
MLFQILRDRIDCEIDATPAFSGDLHSGKRSNTLYFPNVIDRVKLGQPQGFEPPRTREEVLQKMEERAGPAGRKMLAEFLVWLDRLERGRSSD